MKLEAEIAVEFSEHPTAGKHLSRIRILVVDDQEAIRVLHTMVLTREGYQVHVAPDGEQAWRSIQLNQYDLVLTDNHMPHMTGLELVSRMRLNGISTPVIMITGADVASIPPTAGLQITAIHNKTAPMSTLLESVKAALQLSETVVRERSQAPGRLSSDLAHEPLCQTSRSQSTEQNHRDDMMCKRVLIAEPDKEVRTALGAVLESEGYVVEETADCDTTLSMASASPPDLLLLDLNLDFLDSWWSCLRSKIRDVPVIVTTARSNEFGKAKHLGANAFMEKPLNIVFLLEAVRRLSRGQADRSGESWKGSALPSNGSMTNE